MELLHTILFVIVARLMNQDPVQQASRSRGLPWFLAAFRGFYGSLCRGRLPGARRSARPAGSCQEPTKRASLQRSLPRSATRLSKLLSNFDTALHNCAIIYYRGFKEAGIAEARTPAAGQSGRPSCFGLYLKLHPEESRFVDFMSTDLDRFGPTREGSRILGGRTCQGSQEHRGHSQDSSDPSYGRRLEESRSIGMKSSPMPRRRPRGKARALKNIGNIIASKLLYNRLTIKWQERLEIADIGDPRHAARSRAAARGFRDSTALGQPLRIARRGSPGGLGPAHGDGSQPVSLQAILQAEARRPRAGHPSPGPQAPKRPSPKRPSPTRPIPRGPSPKASEPEASKPEASKPEASKPAARKPAASKPAARKPAARKPAARKPAASKPAASKPDREHASPASEPAASEPADERARRERACRGSHPG